MTRHLLLCAALLFAISGIAQTAPRLQCGNEHIIQYMEGRYPGYQTAVQSAFDAAKRQSASRSAMTIYTIPVVFHIVWKDSTENLPDSVIFSQMTVLNNDYRRLNADTINTIAYFDSVAADCGINFHLNGISRVHTTRTIIPDAFGFPDSLIKDSNFGGDDAADPDHNLNIWVVKLNPSLQGQILGYSYPPAGLSNWPFGTEAPVPSYDGVVLDYRTVGSNNRNKLVFNSQLQYINGRTATHEVGHYLGLRHIWGDGTSPQSGTNDCQQSDGIDDTPFADAASNFDCNTFRNSCPNYDLYYNADAPDMVQNYMDYSSERCMNLFTKGQASLMRGVLQTQRSLLPAVTRGIADHTVSPVTIYPNPSSGWVYVSLAEAADVHFAVYDLLGQRIPADISTAANQSRIDLSSYPDGIYMLDLSQRGQHSQYKIAITRP